MYRLYASKDSGSIVAEAMFEEIGVGYEKIPIDLDADEQHGPEYLAVNPLGQIPALLLPDGTLMTESAAIVMHLGDSHSGAGLVPPTGSPQRARFYRWLVFMAVNLYTSDLRLYYPERFTTDPGGAKGVAEAAGTHMDRHFAILNDALEPGPFLLGEAYSAADIYLWMLTGWHPDPQHMLAENPRIQKLVEQVEARPAIARVRAEHFD